MKRILFLLMILTGLGLSANAQTGGVNVEHYTLGDLDKLGKLELSAIYIAQVNKLNLLLPYVPFNQKGDAISLSGMGIPSTKDNNGAIKDLDGSGGSYNEVLDEKLSNIIPYADKEDIIKSILFLQNVIEKIEGGI